MSTLVLIFPMLLSNPGHVQYINYPTHRACISALAKQNAQVIDKDFSFCKPTPLTNDNSQKLTLSRVFNDAITKYSTRPNDEYHN